MCRVKYIKKNNLVFTRSEHLQWALIEMKKYYIFLFTFFLASFNLLADDGFAIDKKSRIASVHGKYFESSIGHTFIGPLLEHDQRSQTSESTHLVLLVPNAPTGAPIQSFCDSATVADIIAMPDPGGTITWYDAATGGNILNPSDTLAQGDLVFAAQTVGGLESTDRLQVLVHFLNPRIVPANPTICAGDNVELTVEFDLPVIVGVNEPFYYQGKYIYSTNFKDFYHNHLNHIRSFGGDLLSIHDSNLNELIRNYINTGHLIGLNDVQIEGQFEWSDGSPVDYLNWNPGEPNNVGDEDVVNAYPNQSWVDSKIIFKYYALYQINLNSPGILWYNSSSNTSITISPFFSETIWVDIEMNAVTCRIETNLTVVDVPVAPISGGDQTACE